MACGPCHERRQLMAKGYAKGGIKGLAKTLPKVLQHLARRGKK